MEISADKLSRGVQVCQDLLQYYEAWSADRADISAACDCIKSLRETLVRLKPETLDGRDLATADAERVQQDVGPCVESLDNLEKKLRKLQRHQLTDELREKTWPELQRLYYPYKRSTLIKLCEIVADVQECLSPVLHGVQPNAISAQIVVHREPRIFQYEALNENGFRLLRLFRGRSGGIECELFHAALENPPRYEALSYTWGFTEPVKFIKVNGRDFQVTDSLYTVLGYIRRHNEDRTLWVDAICINQADIQERTQQVQKMHEIYKCAQLVVIWLGTATAEVRLLLHWLRQADESNAVFSDTTDDERHLLREGLNTLLQRPYFSRVWILQEIANARSAVVCAHDQTIPASLFALAPATLNLPVSTHLESVLDLMLRTSNNELEREQEALDTLLIKFRHCEATNQRDKIFALWNMGLPDEDAEPITPDYTVQESTLVEKTVHYLAKAKKQRIGAVLDFVSAYPSLTGVCIVCHFDASAWGRPWGPPWECTEFVEDLKSVRAQLRDMRDHSDLRLNATHWRIERRSSSAETTTAVPRITHPQFSPWIYDRRMRLPGRHQKSPTYYLKFFTWADNVIVVFYQGSVDSLLSAASGQGFADIVGMLLDQGAEPNAENALYHAVSNDYEEIARMLVQHGANVNARDKYGRSVLHEACLNCYNSSFLEMLLQHGSDVNARDKFGNTVLHMAANIGLVEIAEMLLEHGADVDARTEHECTPLHWASHKGYDKIAETLLEHGADVDARAESECTPLHFASDEGYGGIIEILLDAGADINAQSPERGTALEKALRDGEHWTKQISWTRNSYYAKEKKAKCKKRVEMLLANGARTNPKQLKAIKSCFGPLTGVGERPPGLI